MIRIILWSAADIAISTVLVCFIEMANIGACTTVPGTIFDVASHAK